eukprot:1902723-Prymnesium_polylepis.1
MSGRRGATSAGASPRCISSTRRCSPARGVAQLIATRTTLDQAAAATRTTWMLLSRARGELL